jgi:molybdopterin-guanine dinucleotide biosynthesis protein
MIEAGRRLSGEVFSLIDGNQYFVIHAARQSGKTTLLLNLTERLNREGKYYALYCSLERVQDIIDPEKGIPAIIGCLKTALRVSGIPGRKDFAKEIGDSNYTGILIDSLSDFCHSLDRPLVIFFDEADCLSEGTLISFLRQLRNGYNTRAIAPFVHSLALVGMRNIRDFKARVRPDSETLGSASPFNVVTKAMTLRNFSAEEVVELYAQHTADTGQVFEPAAAALAWQQTQGQPWLVNAIAREIVKEMLQDDYSQAVTESHVEQAIQNIILRRDTHIDSLLERLKEPRVQRIIEPMMLGEERQLENLSNDYRYVLDLGLIRNDRTTTEPANPIYAEVIARTLSYSSQEALKSDVYPYRMSRYFRNGRIDMDFLLRDFQEFWRENSAIWAERFDYKEAAPHLILMAFLQRIINGGGKIIREMAAERRRLDLCLEYEGLRYPIELKLLRGDKTYPEGVRQLSAYMDSLGCSEGWLVVFDRRDSVDWKSKIFTREEKVDGKNIRIVGC